jgi:hypothetical protein
MTKLSHGQVIAEDKLMTPVSVRSVQEPAHLISVCVCMCVCVCFITHCTDLCYAWLVSRLHKMFGLVTSQLLNKLGGRD